MVIVVFERVSRMQSCLSSPSSFHAVFCIATTFLSHVFLVVCRFGFGCDATIFVFSSFVILLTLTDNVGVDLRYNRINHSTDYFTATCVKSALPLRDVKQSNVVSWQKVWQSWRRTLSLNLHIYCQNGKYLFALVLSNPMKFFLHVTDV